MLNISYIVASLPDAVKNPVKVCKCGLCNCIATLPTSCTCPVFDPFTDEQVCDYCVDNMQSPWDVCDPSPVCSSCASGVHAGMDALTWAEIATIPVTLTDKQFPFGLEVAAQ